MTKKDMQKFRRRKAKILKLISEGVPQAEVARRLKLNRQRVCQIVNGK